jgi:hypothetical protein
LELEDVFHILDILFNLFSRTAIRKHRCYVYKRTDTVQKLNSNEVAVINVVNKTLFLRTKRLIAMALGSTDRASKADLQTWYRRLGYVSYESVKRTAFITTGIEINDL